MAVYSRWLVIQGDCYGKFDCMSNNIVFSVFNNVIQQRQGLKLVWSTMNDPNFLRQRLTQI
jgi:hypothetical protein